MAEIINTFLKGKMNQDLDSRIIPNGEYREATNLSISRSESSTVGQFENILGNSKISDLSEAPISASADTEIIGSFVDESSNTAYLFATDHDSAQAARAPITAECYIVSIDLSTQHPTPSVLVQGHFLNFNKSFIFTGINLIENLLFFTDNLNQPRKINVERASFAGYYTNEDQISVAKYAPYEPILVMDRNTTTITGADPSSATITPTSMGTIEVGDIITDNNKINGLAIGPLVTVIGIPAGETTLTLSEAILVPDNTKMDFSRPSMTNQASTRMSNHSGGDNYTVSITGTGIATEYKINGGTSLDFLYSGVNGIPKVGDLVSSITPLGAIPVNTRVASVTVVDDSAAPPEQSISITLNKAPLATVTHLSISDNPNYDAFWKGDVDFLEDKFVRFSYRFKFVDNEYSLIAPWSQVMFIPKQYSQFGGGTVSPTQDMDDAYKSTIVSWFENNINNILLKVPMPYANGQLMGRELNVSAVDILFKESDGLAVQVLETIVMPSVDTAFPTISFYDGLHGEDVIKSFLEYNYASTKPYKTLPSNQTTRVSDKVPVRALAQEVIGNRIVYGNYRDRHTSPSSIAFSATAGNKSVGFDNYTQYPKHQLKQNRTYQVGFVLSDRYGRQSDVILSSYDSVPNKSGSSVFHPYNSSTDQDNGDGLMTAWLGNALKVQLDAAISSTANLALGEPGLYSLDNPLGWFSYKIVVKQQEQEYYNVYLPGFINGYPVLEGTEAGKSFFTTLASDNINKIPRDLKQVGPSDTEYNSSEILTIRVNNPSLVSDNTPWNKQYYPSNLSQRVLSIATARDMEIQAIPFVASSPAGEYGTSAGAIPWGITAPVSSMYNTDSNPFVTKINQSANTNNEIGGKVLASTIRSTTPFLSVAETDPVYSLLDIYWETSLSGNLGTLNSLVNAQYGGVVSADFAPNQVFLESTAAQAVVGTGFNFKNSAGTDIASGITKNYITVTDGRGIVVPDGTFLLEPNGVEWVIKTGINKTFLYDTDVANEESSTGIYTLTANVTYNGLTDNIVLENFSLGNVAPTVTNCPIAHLTGLTSVDTDIYTFTAVNGSADITKDTEQLVWSIGSGNPNNTNWFEFVDSSVGALTVKSSYSLVPNQAYIVPVLATDANGNGLSGVCVVNFTVIGPRVNRALCEGWQTSVVTNCGNALHVQFLESATTEIFGGVTVNSEYYAPNTINNTYNVLQLSQTVTNTTGKLKQGTLYIQGELENLVYAAGTSVSVQYTIQVDLDSTPLNTWQQAQDSTTNSVIYNEVISGVGNGTFPGSKHTFTQPGQYRILTQAVKQFFNGNDSCTYQNTDTTLIFNFGDDNYNGGSNPCVGSPA